MNGGLQPIAPPSAAPYYMAARANGTWTLLKRNPNYQGLHPAKLDAIMLREGLDAEKAVGEVDRGTGRGSRSTTPPSGPAAPSPAVSAAAPSPIAPSRRLASTTSH